MTIVSPSRLSFKKISKTTSEDSVSRLAVGSSAKIMFGLWTIALAIPTRCCSPPDSWEGRLLICLPSPTLFRASSAFFL